MNSSASSLQVKDKLFAGLILAFVLIFIVWALSFGSKNTQPGQYDNFAKCLAGKSITMYGADWCAHCQKEKLAFGNSFQFVPYVECPNDIKGCLAKGIEGYPTWIFPDGKKLVGEQGLEKLSLESGCPLIKN